MKSTLTLTTTLLLALVPALVTAVSPQSDAKIELLSSSWHFHTTQPAHSVLTAQAPQAEFVAPVNAADGTQLLDRRRSDLLPPGPLSRFLSV